MEQTVHLQDISRRLSPILAKNGVLSAGIFGSYARGEETENSDIDLLVELQYPFGLIRLIELKQELEKAMNKKVDIVTPNSLNKFIKPQAIKDLKYIYGQHR